MPLLARMNCKQKNSSKTGDLMHAVRYAHIDSNLYCIVAPGILSPCGVSQPQRGFSYAIGFLPCKTIKPFAALDVNKLYNSISPPFLTPLLMQ